MFTAYAATPKNGASCTKIGLIYKSLDLTLICTKKGTKMTWVKKIVAPAKSTTPLKKIDPQLIVNTPGILYLSTRDWEIRWNTNSLNLSPVHFISQTPEVCQYSKEREVVELLTEGICRISASQEENYFFSAGSVTTSITLLKASQTIDFRGFGVTHSGTDSLFRSSTDTQVETVDFRSNSGLKVSIESTTPKVCKVDGASLILVADGDCSIVASQKGNERYLEAPLHSLTIPVWSFNQFKIVFLTDSDSMIDRSKEIRNAILQIRAWFANQLDGRAPNFVNYNSITVIRDTNLNRMLNPGSNESLTAGSVIDTWRKNGVLAKNDYPIVYADSIYLPLYKQACAWTSTGYIWLPMGNCNIYPAMYNFPAGASYVIAHEITHALGAYMHPTDDNRDVLFVSGGRDWSNLMLDPSHIHYFRTGDPSKPNIEKSTLLTNP